LAPTDRHSQEAARPVDPAPASPPAIGRQAMTLLLRKQNAQDRIEGRVPFGWKEDDYAVVDETRIGRIYKGQLPAGEKWCWFLNGAFVAIPPGIQPSGSVDTLEQSPVR
jgi:hypothetical protein